MIKIIFVKQLGTRHVHFINDREEDYYKKETQSGVVLFYRDSIIENENMG